MHDPHDFMEEMDGVSIDAEANKMGAAVLLNSPRKQLAQT